MTGKTGPHFARANGKAKLVRQIAPLVRRARLRRVLRAEKMAGRSVSRIPRPP
jgi:hypothetical protein